MKAQIMEYKEGQYIRCPNGIDGVIKKIKDDRAYVAYGTDVFMRDWGEGWFDLEEIARWQDVKSEPHLDLTINRRVYSGSEFAKPSGPIPVYVDNDKRSVILPEGSIEMHPDGSVSITQEGIRILFGANYKAPEPIQLSISCRGPKKEQNADE